MGGRKLTSSRLFKTVFSGFLPFRGEVKTVSCRYVSDVVESVRLSFKSVKQNKCARVGKLQLTLKLAYLPVPTVQANKEFCVGSLSRRIMILKITYCTACQNT